MNLMHEDFIHVTEYEVLGKLPDPFLMDDGTRVKTVNDWQKRRTEMMKTAVELQYGTQPPAPEFVEVEKLYDCSYRIHTGTKAHPVSFTMKLHLPENHNGKKCPVVIDGDLCFPRPFFDNWLTTFTDNGIAVALFDRTELAHDVQNEGRRQGDLYRVYPDYTFGAIGAWAWGYSRCVDALEQIGRTDSSCIAFTGHSRGGKTAILAGVLDERAAIVNPNATCAGACSCYRIHMKAINEDGEERVSERLADLYKNYPFWMGEGMGAYTTREQDLPFDSHFLKALVAPRVLLVGEAASDMWASPIGSWMTTEAAREVYRFLGAEENLYWYFRPGYHAHKIEDIERLIQLIHHRQDGTPVQTDYFFRTPFPRPERIFDWRAPEL